MNPGDVLWMALEYAIDDRTEFLSASRRDPKMVRRTERELKAFRRLKKALYGDVERTFPMEDWKPVDVYDLIECSKTRPNLFQWSDENEAQEADHA